MPDAAPPNPAPEPTGEPRPAGAPAAGAEGPAAANAARPAPASVQRAEAPVRRPGLLRRIRRNAGDLWREHRVVLVIAGFLLAFVVAFFWNRIFIRIEAGHAGVLYRLFQGGTVTKHVYGEGLHVIAPWNTMFIYNARVQQVADAFTVLSQDGLAINVEVSIRFRPLYDQLGLLHKHVGYDYVDKVVKPEIQAQFRFVLGQYKPEEIYTSQNFIVQTVVQGALANVGDRHILLDDLLLKAVTLPRPVAEAIESKLRAQQLAQEFDYRLQTEGKEAQRKKIEAQGIRDFQDTITGGGISEEFLRFKGIEATLEIARSPNSKVVIIGGGEDRLPIILDGSSRSGDAAPAATHERPPVSGPPRR
ncbi:prohibitin family protein [Opitutus terrae]|uniref:Band 7 protein n=1 Tax=Opitutus terrae (strain DSM 11246 / JCM 15787 / PB90-1) TaxID=452637 RepID=B1ZYK4_OPITP|nr:prohibitin family protein [Opitutus terrae]ACB75240.1 band 7 protein [Opitutus terrae PB90-1]